MPKIKLSETVIISAAASLIERDGLESLTIQSLAQSLDVKAASLYNHIKGIDDVYIGLAIRTMEGMENMLRNAAVGRHGANALREMAAAYRLFALQNPELYKVFIRSASLSSPELKHIWREAAQAVYRILDAYELDDDGKVHFFRAFRSSLHGFISLESEGFFLGKADKEESFRLMTEALFSSLNERNYDENH